LKLPPGLTEPRVWVIASSTRNDLGLRGCCACPLLVRCSQAAPSSPWLGLGNMFRQHELQFHAEPKTHLDQLTAQLALDDQGRLMRYAAETSPTSLAGSTGR
jgi:hypothetical protein